MTNGDVAGLGASMEPRKALLECRNYVLYYGSGKEDEISKFDLAVLEPKARAAGALRAIKDNGVITLGYLSALEPEPGEDISYLTGADLIRTACGPLTDKTTGNLILDPRSKRCSDRMLRKTGMLMKAGFDGIFVDTIGDVEHPLLKQDNEFMLAARDLLISVRNAWPEAVICQNSGLERLKEFSRGLVDAYCWENHNNAPRNEWFFETLSWLEQLKGTRILLLGQERSAGFVGERERDMAERGFVPGFMSYLAPRDYVAGVNVWWLDYISRFSRRRVEPGRSATGASP